MDISGEAARFKCANWIQRTAAGVPMVLTLLAASACSVKDKQDLQFTGGGEDAGGSTASGATGLGGASSGGREAPGSGGGTPASSANGGGGQGGTIQGGGGQGGSAGAATAGSEGGLTHAGGSGGNQAGSSALGGTSAVPSSTGGVSGIPGGATNGGSPVGGGGNSNPGGGQPGGAGTSGGNGCDQQLLENAGFENGNTQWKLETNFAGVTAIVKKDDAALVKEGVAPQAGQYLAWLGGVPDNKFDSHYIALTQVLRIPAEANLLRLRGFVRIATQEPDPEMTYDRAFIQLEYPDDREDLLWLPVEWSIKNASRDWVAFDATLEDTSKIRGQDVMLRLQSETDPDLVTSFWVDSLELTVRCGR